MARYTNVVRAAGSAPAGRGGVRAFGHYLARLFGVEITRSYSSGPITGEELARLVDAASSTESGVSVTPQGALAISAVYACVRVIAETIASLPLHVYRYRDDGGKEKTPSHPLYTRLHDRPNPQMSSFTFRETMVTHQLLWGNCYAEVERNNANMPAALWPIHPSRVRVVIEQGRKVFLVRVNAGEVRLSADEVLHIPALSLDGYVGLSPVETARRSLGLSAATEIYGAKFFGSGSRPNGALLFEGKLTKESKDRLREEWQGLYGGLENAHKTPILDQGVTFQAMGIPPETAQFLETRSFQTTEIARIFRVPPHLIADLDRATFSNIEQQSLEFVIHTIRPWLVRWEQTLNWDLFGGRSPFFCEFVVEGLLRGDIASRYAAYAVGRQNGWLSGNDIRTLENLNPIPGGDVYLVNSAMVPLDRLNDLVDKQVEPEPAPAPPAAEPPAEPEPARSLGEVVPIAPRLLLAHRALVEDAVGRMVRKEGKAVRAAAKKPEEFPAWLEAFYTRHAEQYAEAILPAVRAQLALTDADADAAVAEIVRAECASARAALAAVAGGADLETAVDDIMTRRERARPREIADALIGEAHDAAA